MNVLFSASRNYSTENAIEFLNYRIERFKGSSGSVSQLIVANAKNSLKIIEHNPKRGYWHLSASCNIIH